jgi:hypothetical protein
MKGGSIPPRVKPCQERRAKGKGLKEGRMDNRKMEETAFDFITVGAREKTV